MKMKKKFFAIVLCMALIVTMLPFNAFAEEAEAQDMNADISAQEVEQADDAEGNISVAEQDSDNEDEENSAVMSASAASGSIAEVSWDDDGNAEYNVVTESNIYVSVGSESNYFSVGKMESGKFCPAEGTVDSCSITVDRDDWSESVSKDEPAWSNPLRAGGFEGVYDCDEETLYLGYNENAIFLGEAAYGAYQVTVNWTAGGTEYSAEIVLNLKPAEMLTRGSFDSSPDSWAKEAGFSKRFYAYDHTEMKDYIYRLKYTPCVDYESSRENNVVILSDGEHGILNFKDSDSDIEGLFAAGKSVKYKSDVTVTPMTVDYSKVTADIMNKVYTLTFNDSAGNEVTCRICFEKDESVDRLEDGRLYAIGPDGTTARDGNVYVSSVEWQVSDCVELTVKTTQTIFFGIWRAQTQQFELAEISTDDLGENMSLEEGEEGCYMVSSDVSGSGNFKTANGETIRYTSTLPSCGIYSAPEKSDENYLTNQISLNDTGKEFYLIADGNGIEKKQLQLNISVTDAFSASYYGEDTKEDNKYFIWKITASDEFEPEDDGIGVDFEILKNNKYYDSTWLYISYAIAAEQQLYWFYGYEAKVDSNGMIETEAEGAQYEKYARTRIWDDENPVGGYFAIKTESGSYKAVDSVISDSPDEFIVTKAEDGYAYSLKWVKEGNYICRATVDGKEYRIKAGFNLPSMGFYSTEDRSIDSYLGNEFHYIDAADENKKEAYFYIITDTCGYELDEVTMTCGRWVRGEWKAKDVNGISIECISDSEKYFVYKVIVSDQYRDNGDSERFGLVTYNGKHVLSEWIQIYDSTEISQEQQLYWFNSWNVETDSKGKLSLPEDTGYNSLDDAASKRLEYYHILNESYEKQQGYFAIKDSEGSYYAVDTVSVPDTDAIEISKNGFEYSIRWKEFGEYQFTAEKDGEDYRFYLIARLPGIGFYKHPGRISENYIEEFYFADAAETGNNGKEAYFYIIASTYGYEADNIEIKTRIYNYGTYEYEDADIQGISVEKLENIPLGSEDCCAWKVTVTDEYKGEYTTSNSRVNFKVVYNENDWNSKDINIYDSETISPEQQMYWFYNGNVSADENGKLTAEEHTTLNGAAQKEMYREGLNSTYGYFAIKDDNGDYYALDNVTVSDSDNVKLSKDGFEYHVSWNQFERYIFKGIRDGKTYKFKLTVDLPYMGFYSHPEGTAANYINEFHFTDAAEKSEDGTKAYFYVIAKASMYGREAEDIAVWYSNDKNEQKSKIVRGISFGQPEKHVYNSKEYYVWKVTVDKKYREGDNYNHKIGVKYVSSDLESAYPSIESENISIYDSTEVMAEEQLYWFDSINTSVNSDGFIEAVAAATDENLDEMASTRQKYRSKMSMRGYFAVKDSNGSYRALNAVTVSDSKNVKIGKNGYEYVVSLQNFGEYQITGIYNGKKYKFNMIAVISEVGFYTHEEKTGDNYLGSTIYFNDIPEKNKDKSEAYVYIIAPTLGYDLKDVKAGVGTWERNESGGNWDWKLIETEGISFGEPQKRTFDSEECFVWKATVGSEYQMSGTEDAISVVYGDSEEITIRYITIYNAETVTPSQQIYYFSDQYVDIVNGKIVFKEGASKNGWTLGNLTCGKSRWVYCFAIQKDGEYYKVDIADAKGIRYSVDETSGATTLIPEKTGKYTLTAVFNGKRYYSQDTIVLPNEGFWSEPNRSDETLLKEFNYNTADENKHFYYIAPSYYFRDADGEIADMKDIIMQPYAPGYEGSYIEAPGVRIGESGSFTEDEQAYYYWEVIVDKSFNTDRVWGYVRMKYDCSGRKGQSNNELKITEYKDYGDSVSVSGTVTGGDNIDNIEMILYRVKDLESYVEGEYTDSKAEAYIKSDIISNSHYGSSATEKGRITGTNGIYSQTYKFANAAEGEYKLAVYKPGYGVHIENVTVSDSTVTRDIKLSLLGDANGDGKVRIGDKAVLARAIAGWTGYENILNKEAADINGDGLIKNDDLMILSRHLAGWLGYSQLEYGRQQIKTE